MTDLYRYYDRDGALLYVGVSDDWEGRLKDHQRYAAWFPKAHQLCLERHRTRESALAAELVAIRAEWPLYNVCGSPWKTGQVLHDVKVERYLERLANPNYEQVPERGTAEWDAYDSAVWAQIGSWSAHRRHLICTRIVTLAEERIAVAVAS